MAGDLFVSKNIKNMVFMLLLLAAILIFVEVSGFGRKAESTINVPEGAGMAQISEMLKENHYIGNAFLFRAYSFITGRTYFAGTHYIGKAGYKNIAEALSAPASEQAATVTFREGIELREIKDKLVELGLCTADDFDTYADKKYYDYAFLKDIPNRDNNLEGYLFPDTYEFSYSEGIQNIINKMLSNFQAKVYDKLKADMEKQNLKTDDVIIMASILEREVAAKDELPVVSGIFYNRLNKVGESRGYLESCATVQYILKERKEVLSVSDTKIDSPYNTYKYQGLPKGPISSPGYDAIYAAIYPQKTDYLYFVTDGSGKHYFAKTYAEHQENMRKAGL